MKAVEIPIAFGEGWDFAGFRVPLRLPLRGLEGLITKRGVIGVYYRGLNDYQDYFGGSLLYLYLYYIGPQKTLFSNY